MSNYLFLFKGPMPSERNLSPDEMQQHMEKWFSWIRSLQERGIYKGGEPLEKGGLIVTSGPTITDGPFPESKEMVGGFVIVEADSLEAASEIAKDCPALELDGKVEVREVAVIDRACPEH